MVGPALEIGLWGARIGSRRLTVEGSANYRSARLTPQSDAHPSFVLNVGARQNLYGERISLTMAVSDLLKTQRQETELNVEAPSIRGIGRASTSLLQVGVPVFCDLVALDAEHVEPGRCVRLRRILGVLVLADEREHDEISLRHHRHQ